ncbi:PAS domain S-box protein [Brevibacterium sp. 'Marine']|uniref:PAS domain S-box protein n=1 Tax=Brevibacterium sp. 'Marine' TaxID=2725563 RepID=UPI00145EEF7C|nr:PAS domain S-box protein [Brevibacterium sp. 'Marine']
MSRSSKVEAVDFKLLFESLPDMYIVVRPDRTIVAATDSFLESTGKDRETVLDMDILEAYPDNPDDPEAKGTQILRGSIERVLSSKKTDVLPPVRYDLANREGEFEVRWFQPLNAPAFDDSGEIAYVLHGAVDITEQMEKAD